ncbi:Putative F-box domain protein [Aspergillus calidoustus]|uniref:Putative F-box domain protein n=1 Tax=Aspergillus calidoustus TaxID=454130 RepID=A0A0U5GHF5_ASPCI|nr:Putative F-box domain protein [Aspergillus calidoustus]
MGGWAIFCALCGGPFSSQVDMDCEGTDERAYRFDILEDCNLDWLDELQALGMNPDATGSDKSFLTGVGRYWDCGGIEVLAGNYINTPFPADQVVPMVAYHDFSEIGLPHVFPFHPVCYEALRRCICLRQPDSEIRGDALYRVFEEANGGRYVRLALDYGDPDPPAGQVWETLLGQEILVVNPVDIPELQAEVRDIKSLLRTKVDRRGDDEIKGHAGDDIFSRLPIELRHKIFEYLRPESIMALKAASRVMHTTSCPDSLWAAKLVETYPWLWELHELDVFQSQDLEEKTFRLLRACRGNGASSSKSHSYVLGLANRRRIWGVCEQLRSQYVEKLAV